MFQMPPWVYRLQEYFRGRNGIDGLNIALLVMMFVSRVVTSFFEPKWVAVFPSLFLLVFIMRVLSRNLSMRQKENAIFMRWFEKAKKFWKKLCDGYNAWFERWTSRKTHTYPKCPACKKRVRVPKGKGTIRITCPYCRNKFEKKT